MGLEAWRVGTGSLGGTGWTRKPPPATRATFLALNLGEWAFNPFLCSTHSCHPPNHQRPSSMRQVALFTGVGLSAQGRSGRAAGSDLGQLRVGAAPEASGSSRAGPQGRGVSASASPPGTLRGVPQLPAASILPFCRDKARLVMDQRQVKEERAVKERGPTWIWWGCC